MRGLKGRRAIIAGGAGGIGAAICRRLAEEGMQVVCADISEKRGRAVAQELSEEGLPVSFEHLDAGDPASWDRLAAVQPRIDALVTAAYFARGGQIPALSNEDWEENFRVTLGGARNRLEADELKLRRKVAHVPLGRHAESDSGSEAHVGELPPRAADEG